MLSIVLLSFALSIDGFFVGIAFGIKKVRFKFYSVFTIAVIAAAAIALSLIFGNLLKFLFPEIIEKIVSGSILFLLAIRQFISGFKTERKKIKHHLMDIINCPESGDLDLSGEINFKETLLLSLALNLDAFCAGLGAGMASFSCILIPMVGLFLFMAIYSGLYIGKHTTNLLLKNKGYILSSILLVLIGIKNIL